MPALPTRTSPAADRYVRAMQPCASGDAFERGDATGAVTAFVREMEAAHVPAAAIVQMSVDLLPIAPEARDTVWAISLRDWTATTAREALRLPLLDRRSAVRAGVAG
jgi:hypothetical protein